MDITRFFVTAVVLFASLSAIGCGNKDKRKKADPLQAASLQKEGKAKWDETETLGKELQSAYGIVIIDQSYRTANRVLITSKLMGQKFNWHRLTRAERQGAKEKLAQYISAVSRIMQIDAKRGIYVTNMDRVRSRYEGALAFQASLDQFEKVLGEQYESKTPGQPPVYFSPIDI